MSQLQFAPYAPPPDAPRPSLSSWSTPAPAPASDPPPAASSSSSYQSGAPISSLSDGTSFSSSPYSAPYGSSAAGGYANLPTAGSGALTSGYETTTVRHDYAGPICYAFGPLGAAAMLVLEIENDFVRFHAWQSVMVNAALVLVHLFFLMLFGRGFFQYLLVFVDIGVLTLLTLRAYRDSDHLERYKVGFLGDLADQFVRAE